MKTTKILLILIIVISCIIFCQQSVNSETEPTQKYRKDKMLTIPTTIKTDLKTNPIEQDKIENSQQINKTNMLIDKDQNKKLFTPKENNENSFLNKIKNKTKEPKIPLSTYLIPTIPLIIFIIIKIILKKIKINDSNK